jgi:hypothetical protein
MKIKTTTAFRAYATARQNRANDAKSFMVKSVNKDGSISRMAPTRSAWKYDAFATAEDAEKRRAQLEAMNPGSRYAVVAL